jgi:uncharacterized surface protein with fasciclin (FAS1) repeats
MKLSGCLLAFAFLLGSATATVGPRGRALLQDRDNDDDDDNRSCRTPLQTLAGYPGTFRNLTAAVQVAGLTDYLNNTQLNIGVFAPTDRAFARLATRMSMSVAQLAQNADLIKAVVLYHVIADDDDLDDLAEDRTENTYLGPNLNITAVRTQNPQNVTQPASAPGALPPATAASAGRKLLQDRDNDNDNDDDNNNNNNNNDNDNDDDNNNNNNNDNDDDNNSNNNNNSSNNNDDDNDDDDRFEEGEDDSYRSLYLVSAAGSVARVTVANIDACEATVHVIDTVLIPPTQFLSAPIAVTLPDPNTVRVVSGPANSPVCTSTISRGTPTEDDDDLRVEDNCPNFD